MPYPSPSSLCHPSFLLPPPFLPLPSPCLDCRRPSLSLFSFSPKERPPSSPRPLFSFFVTFFRLSLLSASHSFLSHVVCKQLALQQRCAPGAADDMNANGRGPERSYLREEKWRAEKKGKLNPGAGEGTPPFRGDYDTHIVDSALALVARLVSWRLAMRKLEHEQPERRFAAALSLFSSFLFLLSRLSALRLATSCAHAVLQYSLQAARVNTAANVRRGRKEEK